MSLKSLLNKYLSSDPEEVIHKKHMLDFLEKNQNCFERSCLKGHFTASCWLVDKTNTKALLTHHRKLNDWFQLGGHCDGDSDVLKVAIKEAQEESGINNIEAFQNDIFDIDIHKIPKIKNIEPHLHYDIRFILQIKSDEIPLKNHESKELRWINKDIINLPTNSRSVMRMFEKWVNKF